jgi:hypothetical protein
VMPEIDVSNRDGGAVCETVAWTEDTALPGGAVLQGQRGRADEDVRP